MDSLKPQRWFDERPGRWIAEEQWPSPDIVPSILYFSKYNHLSTEAGNVELSISSDQDCGAESPEYFPFAFGDELPGDQTADDEKSLCFDSAPMEADTDIVGAPVFRLTAASDSPTGQIAVRLTDLRPDGTSAMITYGVLNLAHRNSHEFPKPMTPGLAFETSFPLDQIAYRLPKGHRLRIAISTAWFPFIWPSPDVMTLTIKSGSIELPLRPTARASEWKFEKPEGAPAWKAEELRPGHYKRESKFDESTGETITIINCDFGENRDQHHGLISGGWFKDRYSIRPHDPLSAKAVHEWEMTGGREGQMYRTHVLAEFTSDKEHFHPRATLKCWENDRLVFEKTFDDKIRRNLV